MGYNYFPAGYQAQPMFYPQQAQPQQKNGRIYVQGEAGGKSYLVAPNTTVDLWDVEAPFIYVKSADANGVPTMRVFKYEEVTSAPVQTAPTANYATKDDVAALKAEIDNLRMNLISVEETPEKAKKEGTK